LFFPASVISVSSGGGGGVAELAALPFFCFACGDGMMVSGTTAAFAGSVEMVASSSST
jgi:hypothetical protein